MNKEHKWKIAIYLKDNSLAWKNKMIRDCAEWFNEGTGIDDFYLGSYTDGELFIEIEGVEIPFRKAIFWLSDMWKSQQKLRLIF